MPTATAPTPTTKLTPHAAAIKQRHRDIAAADAAVAVARRELAAAHEKLREELEKLAPFRDVVRVASEGLIRAETSQEQAVVNGNRRVTEALSADELHAIEAWRSDVRDELNNAMRIQNLTKHSAPDVLSGLFRAVDELKFEAAPLAKIAELRAAHKVPEIERRRPLELSEEVVAAARKIVASAA